jgi:hypothetical protein
MKTKLVLIVCTLLVITACDWKNSSSQITLKYISPQNDSFELKASTDTIRFNLDEDIYNSVKSFNLFSTSFKEYISFYDAKSITIALYDFNSRVLVKKVPLKPVLQNEKPLKTGVFVKNFDTIIVTNGANLFLIDSSGKVKIKMSASDPSQFPVSGGQYPPFFTDGCIFTSIRPNIDQESLASVRNYKVLYKFDSRRSLVTKLFPLPKFYSDGYYGDNLFKYNHCINDKGQLILSFWADSLIYQYDFNKGPTAFIGKSKYQYNNIAATKKDSLRGKGDMKHFLMQDSYGPVLFDPYRKLYYRVFNLAISEDEYAAKSWKKKQSLVILDENLRIIGNSSLTSELSIATLVFSQQGVFSRINYDNEYAIEFIKLECNHIKNSFLVKN